MANDISRRSLLKSSITLATAASVAPVLGFSAAPALSFTEYRANDALGLASLVSKGEVSALELLELAISRSEVVNPSLNCVVEELYDRARSAIKAGLPQGTFTGVPFMLKDLGMMLEGTVTTNGSRFYKDARMDYTSTVVDR